MSNDDGNSGGGFPSLTALLGLLAVAGYQHRDQIADWVSGKMGGGQGAPPPAPAPANAAPGQPQGGGGLFGSLGGLLGAGGAGALLNGGLGELVDRFNQAGQGDKANSWVGTGANQDVAPHELEQALGPQVIDAIARQTGLSREDLLARLSKVLPEAVDRYTPDGSLGRAGA